MSEYRFSSISKIHCSLYLRAYILDSLTHNVTPYGVKAIHGIQMYLNCIKVDGTPFNLKPIWLKVVVIILVKLNLFNFMLSFI